MTTEFLSPLEEARLRHVIGRWTFRRIPMRGGYLRRQLLCFGVDFGANFRTLHTAPPLPVELRDVRARCAALAGYASEELNQVIVQRYPPGAGIGWHRDDLRLGAVVIGVSLGSDATLRFARHRRAAATETIQVPIPARSAYILRDEARYRWLHSLAAVRQARISLTFRAAPA